MVTEGYWLAHSSHEHSHLGIFLQAQTVAPVRSQGLLGHTPVPQMEILVIREDLGMR